MAREVSSSGRWPELAVARWRWRRRRDRGWQSVEAFVGDGKGTGRSPDVGKTTGAVAGGVGSVEDGDVAVELE
jgi:hypothetical protein